MKHFLTIALLGASFAAHATIPSGREAAMKHPDFSLYNVVKPGSKKDLDAKQYKGANPAKTRKQFAAPNKADAKTYTGVFQSFYEYYEFYHDGGEFLNYNVDITIDGTSATIKNLFNFEGEDYPSCTELEIKGKYDPETHTISIPTPRQYDQATVIGSYYGYLPVVLVSGTVSPDQLLTNSEQLVFTVSEDGNKISTQQDFGAMIYKTDGSPYGFKSVYTGGVMKQSIAEPEAVCFNDNIEFGSVYTGETGEKYIRIFNLVDPSTSAVDVAVSIAPESFSAEAPSITVSPMDFNEFVVTYTPTNLGAENGTMTLTCGAQSQICKLSGNAIEKPDYSYLVKSGEMTFSTGADTPFLPFEVDGVKAARSNNKNVDKNNSYLTVNFTVPEGQLGILKWKGFANSTVEYGGVPEVLADDIPVISYAGMYKKVIDDEWKFAPGQHSMKFNYLVDYATYFYPEDDYMYIHDLELITEDIPDSKINILTPTVNFENSIQQDENSVIEKYAYVKLRNEGAQDLTVTEIKGSAHFSGELPWNPTAMTLEEMQIALTFSATAPGDYNEKVTIVTSAGDAVVDCHALVREMPNFQSIVKEGDFTFTTTEANPWLVESGVAYNSTAKIKDEVVTYCGLTANFNVPEGKVGILSWQGSVSSSPIDNYTDYLGITIQGGGIYSITTVPGEFDLNSDLFPYYEAHDPKYLTLAPGNGSITFNYVQFGDGVYYGEDMAKIHSLGLKLIDAKDFDAQLLTTEVSFPDTYQNRKANAMVRLYNSGVKPLEALTVEGDGNFAGLAPAYTAEFQQVLEVPVYFVPKVAGDITGQVVIKTTAGDFTVICKGKAISTDGILLIEDFEADINWQLYDRDSDGDCWDYAFNAFGGYTLGHTHSGDDCIVSFSRDRYNQFTPDNWTFTPMVTIPKGKGAQLKWWSAADYGDPEPLGDIYSVYVAEGEANMETNGFVIEEYDLVHNEELQSTDWTEHTIDLSKYSGLDIHVAFRHHNCTGKYMVKIDDVSIIETELSSIINIKPEGKISSVRYYGIDGVQRPSVSENGVTICVTTYENGATVTRKILK